MIAACCDQCWVFFFSLSILLFGFGIFFGIEGGKCFGGIYMDGLVYVDASCIPFTHGILAFCEKWFGRTWAIGRLEMEICK